MRARSWLAIALSAGVVGVTACSAGLYLWARTFFAQSGTGSDAALAWNDRYETLDTESRGGHRYVLIRVWTTVPDLMQRVDLYCYNGHQPMGEPTRVDFKHSRQVLSENLDDHYHLADDGRTYTARWPTRGAIDLGKTRVTVEFDSGVPQVISISESAMRARCPQP